MSFKVCQTYISKHGLKGKDQENLKTMCNKLYSNVVLHTVLTSYIDGPRHVFRQMQLLKSLEPYVQDIVKPGISRYISVIVIHDNKHYAGI